jgi:hypothetical protein
MPFGGVGTFYCVRLGWFLAVAARRGFYSHGPELEAAPGLQASWKFSVSSCVL